MLSKSGRKPVYRVYRYGTELKWVTKNRKKAVAEESVRQSDGSGSEEFLTCVSHTAHVIAIGWMSVRPSVCLSVTRWYCICIDHNCSNCKLHLHCLVAP